MSRNSAMTVALTDLKIAMKVKYVKYSLIMAGALGPGLAIITIVSTLLAVPPSDQAILLAILLPYTAAMIGLLSIIPASMIAANALVGEREQKTLEPLLATPLTDRELLVGKVLSALLPSLILLVAGTLATLIASNIVLVSLGLPLMLIPDLPGLFLLFAATPTMIFAVIAIMILISGKVSRVYEAYQTSGPVVIIFMIPMLAPLMGLESTGGIPATDMIWLSNIVTFLIGAVLMLVTWALALKRFNRDTMVSLV